MCFSATASFSAAAFLTLAGAASLSKVRKASDAPLAAVPLLFAAQQAIEGVLWLTVPDGHAAGQLWATAFAVVALIVWPLVTPLAVGLAETDRKRRRWILALSGPGLGAAGYSLLDIARHPYLAWPAPHSLVYINDSPFPIFLTGAYLAATCLPPLLSSATALRWFGVIITLGLALTLGVFFVNLVSVWCFFAALASLVLVAHFRRLKLNFG